MTFNKSYRGVLLFWLWLIIGLVIFLSSCMTAKNLPKHNDKFPQESADYFSKKFPVTDSIIVKEDVRFDTLYVEGEPEIIRDTVLQEGETITRVIEKKCPPHKVVTKTVTKDSIRYIRDVARERALDLQNVALVKENRAQHEQIDKLKDKRNWWMIACLITWGLTGIYIALKVKRIIPI